MLVCFGVMSICVGVVHVYISTSALDVRAARATYLASIINVIDKNTLSSIIENYCSFINIPSCIITEK